MGRKSQKSKDKKMAKRAEEKMARDQIAASQALVDEANKMKDPMEHLAPFKKYDRNGLSLVITCERVTNLDKLTVDWAYELTKNNMESLYESSGWGWSDKQKKEEMTEDAAWYLIARDAENRPVAVCHFRFDIDNEDEVLYCEVAKHFKLTGHAGLGDIAIHIVDFVYACPGSDGTKHLRNLLDYEVQLEKIVRRKGLGKFLVQILELMALKMKMKKVMMTIFKENEAAKKFFKDKLKYKIDETSPEESFAEAMFDEDTYTYEILSKDMAQRKPLSKMTPQQPHACAHGCAH